MNENVIRDVVTRTKGELYIGVVGSVRSGKSTFIRRFMEKKVLPLINDEDLYKKVLDELPQSSEGKVIMTVEPKFIPSNNMRVSTNEDCSFNVRLIDCVGYVLEGAKGYLNEDGSERLITTPWFEEEIPFEEAATIGTKKVIENHSNIGIVITSDGSFGDFTRDEYEEAEAKIIKSLQEVNKPFVIVFNTTKPYATETLETTNALAEKYKVAVIPVNVIDMSEADIDEILKQALNEFEIDAIDIQVPDWISLLKEDLSFKREFNEKINEATSTYHKMKDIFSIQTFLRDTGLFENVAITEIDPGTGVATINLEFDDEIYNDMLTEILGEKITNRARFIEVIQDLTEAKVISQKIGTTIKAVDQCGYGLSIPDNKDMVLSVPELIKQNGRYGIKIKATAPTLHIVKIDVESTFEPIIGSMEQSQALIDHMLEDYEQNPDKLWNSEIFGRKLCDVINDGIKAKLYAVPDDVQYKYKEALNKVINQGKGGIIAIIL